MHESAQDRVARIALDAAFQRDAADRAARRQRFDQATERIDRERATKRAERDAAEDAARLAAVTAELRAAYFAAAPATEDDFQRALPGLLEARRRAAALAGDDPLLAEGRALLQSGDTAI